MGQTSLNEMLRAAESEIAAGRLEQALTLCQEAQVRYPRSLHVQRVLGEVYLAQRKTREAVAVLDRALAGNPEDARACCARAIVQQIQGDSLGALGWYRRACDIRPHDQVLRSAYRELATSLGQPVYEPTRLGLATLYLRSNLLPHALREWEAILAEDADSVAAQVGLIVTLWRAGETTAAAERCRRTLLNTPTCVNALLVLALLEKQAGNVQETERLMQRVGELDPEMRMARELFADQITAEDPVVYELLGLERPAVQAPAPRRAVTAVPPPEPRTQPVHTTPPPPQPVPIPANETRLPPNFGKIFDETRDMLWRDEDNQTVERRPSDRQSERPQVDMFARSNIYIPPVMRERGANLEDTETRVAINWLSWLQAQGAIPQPGMQRTPTSRPLRPTESLPASGEYGNGDIVTGPLPPWIAETSPQSGTLPPATPEALRAMFAELEPDNRIVEGEVVSAMPSGELPQQSGAPDTFAISNDGQNEPVEAEIEQNDFAAPWEEETGAYAGVSSIPEEPDTAASGPEEWQSDDTDTGELDEVETSKLDASFHSFQEPTTPVEPVEIALPTAEESPEPDTSPVPEQPVTLEALEQGFAASGFQSYDLQPGTLQTIAAEQDAEQTPEPLSPDSVSAAASTTAPLTPPLMPRPTYGPLPAEPEDDIERAESEHPYESLATAPDIPALPDELDTAADAPAPAEAAPADYPARLDLARKRRSAGQLGDALTEYRTVLKNAPDLLSEVVTDLEQSLAETPDQPELHRLLGDARVRQGDYLSALESYNRAVALAQNQSTSN